MILKPYNVYSEQYEVQPVYRMKSIYVAVIEMQWPSRRIDRTSRCTYVHICIPFAHPRKPSSSHNAGPSFRLDSVSQTLTRKH